ncbi:trypsin-like serine protease [Sorangium sp. So ce131]|uniref:trypsin-like serine protease n=1 Tax=Sorangium sp. So ce131 TaxID=3133282 RepID=UPI003F5FF2EF
MKRPILATLGTVFSAFSLMACMAGEAPQDVDQATGEEVVSEAEQAIKNGTPATPDEAMVVSVWRDSNLCTGMLLSPSRVLTAAHCLTSTHTGDYTVTYAGEDRAISQILKHPNVSSGVDVGILVLSTAYSLGPLTEYPQVNVADTDGLIGREVTCYGYGAEDVGGTCTSNADCATGFTCITARHRCYKPTTTLRKGDFTVISDPDKDDIWFRLDVLNASGQTTLPGDSGGPCILENTSFGTKHVVGVHKAGNNTDMSTNTSREAFAAWVLAND